MLSDLNKQLEISNIVSVLIGLKYAGNVGNCYRNANVIGNNIPTILVKPDINIHDNKISNSSKQIIYHQNKYINYFILIVLYLLNFIISPKHKIKSFYKTPYNNNNEYNSKFINDVKYFGANKSNPKEKYIISPFYYNISWNDLLILLKNNNYCIYAVESYDNIDTINLYDLKLDKNKKYAIVFGSESNGIPHKYFDDIKYQITIPTYHKKSLNVSTAHGIVINYLYNLL